MKITSVSVSYSCKFNDPQKRYTNHNYNAEATATVEEGEDPDKIRQQLATDLEAFVHGRRAALFKAAELEKKFDSVKQEFKYAVDNVRRYEEGTRQAADQMKKANEYYTSLQSLQTELAGFGMKVSLPQACIDLPSAKPALAEAINSEEEGNDPDESVDQDDD